MTAPDPMAARAALDAARVVFGHMTAERDGEPASAAAASLRADDAWSATEQVLQRVTGRADLQGHLLVSEARRQSRLSMEDAYPLVALQAWCERVRDPAHASPMDDLSQPQERVVAADALRALERAVQSLDGAARVLDAPPPSSPPPRPDLRAVDVRMLEEVAAPAPSRGFFGSAGFIIAVVVLLIAGAAGGWYAFSQRTVSSEFDDGVAAYQRGAREVARIAFANAARKQPGDERPLIFLGRLAREEGNLASARRFLDAAIKVAPTSPVALREMGAVLLADGNPELARRFYVRALQVDPTDRLAQGFLGCALHRLGRPDEAQRWTERAGPGDWTPCLAAPVPAAPTPAPAR